MAVQWPQVWLDECMAIGFIQLLQTASLRTLQTKIAACDNHYRGLGETGLSRHLVCGRPSGLSVSSPIAVTFNSVRVHSGPQLPCLDQPVLRVYRSLLSHSFCPVLPGNSTSSLHECAALDCFKRMLFNHCIY